MARERKTYFAELNDCMYMFDSETGVTNNFTLHRRSYLGLFVRRSCLRFAMMLEHERMQLVEQCRLWRDGVGSAQADEWTSSSQAHAYRMWRESERRGDYVKTKHYLQAFFDYTLPGCDKYVHVTDKVRVS